MEVEYLDGRKLSERRDRRHGHLDHVRGLPHQLEHRDLDHVELARHPEFAPEIAREVDSVYARAASSASRRCARCPLLERFVFETLRLHPPLVTLMRRVMSDFHVQDQVIPEGDTIVVSPYVTHRIPELYPDPGALRSEPPAARARLRVHPVRRRAAQVRRQRLRDAPGEVDLDCALLARYDFELVDAPETYRDVMPSLILRR